MRRLIVTLTCLTLFACSTSTPLQQWRDPGFSQKLDNILVIGVSERSERRRQFEDRFVAALEAGRVAAVPSYSLIESTSDLTRSGVEQAIEGKGLGAVLVTRLAGVEEQQIERLPTSPRSPYRSFGGYYDQVLQQNNAGYYSKFQVLTLETHLYDTQTKQLVWSLQSEVIDSSQPQQMIEDQIRLTIEQLRAQGLLGG